MPRLFKLRAESAAAKKRLRGGTSLLSMPTCYSVHCTVPVPQQCMRNEDTNRLHARAIGIKMRCELVDAHLRSIIVQFFTEIHRL